ncbi:MAG: hypothetical protein OEZ38_00725 [Gammaproteobacteria bacterium]|nr:hypothetical protein [Gammaproteobacteria bacterium]
MKFPFSSIAEFSHEFNKGLHVLASKQGLGPFILVCANATVHEEMFDEFKPSLERQYQELYDYYRQAFADGCDVDVVDEDLLVFLKMHAIGFESIRHNEVRKEDLWKIQFNHIRSFRPRRITRFIHEGISEPYNEDGFNFNKKFMASECFWSGELMGRDIDLFYNKYPFADLHGLLVLDKTACKPQVLRKKDHDYIFKLALELDSGFPGVGFGYNSYGAYASVNHLHFQMIVDEEGLPVMDNAWKHNGGDKEYPVDCFAYESVSASWNMIRTLHHLEQPYNILYVPGRVYIFPRKAQGMVEVPGWSSGFTWYELSGGMISFNYNDYTSLTTKAIENHLSMLKLDRPVQLIA